MSRIQKRKRGQAPPVVLPTQAANKPHNPNPALQQQFTPLEDEFGGAHDELDTLSFRSVLATDFIKSHELMDSILANSIRLSHIIPPESFPIKFIDKNVKCRNNFIGDGELLKEMIKEQEKSLNLLNNPMKKEDITGFYVNKYNQLSDIFKNLGSENRKQAEDEIITIKNEILNQQNKNNGVKRQKLIKVERFKKNGKLDLGLPAPSVAPNLTRYLPEQIKTQPSSAQTNEASIDVKNKDEDAIMTEPVPSDDIKELIEIPTSNSHETSGDTTSLDTNQNPTANNNTTSNINTTESSLPIPHPTSNLYSQTSSDITIHPETQTTVETEQSSQLKPEVQPEPIPTSQVESIPELQDQTESNDLGILSILTEEIENKAEENDLDKHLSQYDDISNVDSLGMGDLDNEFLNNDGYDSLSALDDPGFINQMDHSLE